jgi:cobalt-zinc-cadmium efflux system outer membrane protein
MSRWLIRILLIQLPWLALPEGACAQVSLEAPIAIEATSYDLEQLTLLADQYSPILRRDQAQVDAARGNALQASLYPNPAFDTNNPQVFQGRNTLLNVGFQQDIVTMGKIRLDTAAALKVVRQTEVVFHQDRFALYGAVRVQFFHVLAGQKRVETLQKLVAVLKKAYAVSKKLTLTTSKFDVLLVEIDLQKIQAELLKAQNLLEGDRKELAAIVGLPNLRFAKVAGDLDTELAEFDEETLRRFVATQHTQIQIGKLEIERNEILFRRARAEAVPNFRMGPAYQYGLTPGNDQFWFNITFPIPLWNRNQGAIRAAQANIRNAAETVQTVRNELIRQVADALSNHLAARRRVEKYRLEILPNAKKASDLALAGIQTRKGPESFDFLRFLQAQRAYVETYKDYVDALEDFWTTAALLSGLLQKESFP